jgi:Tfp pilus assembly protein PilN
MAQQINLHTPILLQPRQQFSAGAMARALLTLALALLMLGAWMMVQNRALRRDGDQTEQRQKAEHDQLKNSLATLQKQVDRVTLEQQLRGLEQDIAQERRVLAELDRGRAHPGWAHSDLLALVARTVPPPAWVTELRFSPDRIQISGMTLDPPALQHWITQLSLSEALQGRPWAEVQVEAAGRGGSGLQGDALAQALHPSALPSGQGWAFRIAADRTDTASRSASKEATP